MFGFKDSDKIRGSLSRRLVLPTGSPLMVRTASPGATTSSDLDTVDGAGRPHAPVRCRPTLAVTKAFFRLKRIWMTVCRRC